MNRFISYIVFSYLIGLAATSGLPVMAGGCNSHMNKKAEIICTEDDAECQTEKAEKIELNETIRS